MTIPEKSLRFALLGYDPLLDPLIAQLASGGHRLVWISTEEKPLPGWIDTLDVQIARPGQSSDWEGLLHGDLADVVLVGRGDLELREDQLRRLVQARIGTVVAHPASLAPLFCYELDMICRENGCFLLPYYPGADHADLHRLADLIQRSKSGVENSENVLGEIEQITFERLLKDRSQAAVLDQLARDVDLLITICGTQTKVSALGTGEGEKAYAGLSVQFTGPDRIVTRWSVNPSEEESHGRIVVSGSKGVAELSLPADCQQWQLAVRSNTREQEAHANSSTSPYEAALTLAEISAGFQRSQEEKPASAQEQQRWFQACQSIDLLDAVQRSLVKGRTIELHFEDYTSEATFKGRMSAIGCAVLMLGLMTCVVGFVSDLFGGIYLNVVGKELPPVTRWWPGLLLAGLVFFLFIQVLPKFFPETPDKEDAD